MHAGADVFETCVWIGRFWQEWVNNTHKPFHRILRATIKNNLCGLASAKDKNIRQALIDRYGGNEHAIGGVKCSNCKGKGRVGRDRVTCGICNGGGWKHPPGPLKGIAGDVWSALAVAVTYADTRRNAEVGAG